MHANSLYGTDKRKTIIPIHNATQCNTESGRGSQNSGAREKSGLGTDIMETDEGDRLGNLNVDGVDDEGKEEEKNSKKGETR